MLQIFAIDLETNKRFEINDLYWFEEEGIHDFGGEACYAKYAFEIFVYGVLVFSSNVVASDAADLLPCGHHKDALVGNGVRQWCVACESANRQRQPLGAYE